MRSDGPEWGTYLERTVVDQMGMAYGISGRNKKAEKIFRDAIKDDPEYPMYHYNLACALAEQDQMKKAAPELVKAFELRDNMMGAERLPNPQNDPSFRPHVDDPAFKKAMRKIREMMREEKSSGRRRR